MPIKTCVHSDFGSKLLTNINNAVSNNTSNSEVLLALSIAVNGVGRDLYNTTVSNTAGLPNLQSCSIGSGFLLFNDELKQPVISKNCGWFSVDGKQLRNDADVTCNVLLSQGCMLSGSFGINCGITASAQPFFVQEFTNSSWKDMHIRRNTVNAIKTDGSLWSWGCGSGGILGNSTAPAGVSSPVREISSSTWTKVSGGLGFTNGIKTDGSIWSWGCGTNGRLGNGFTSATSSPVREFCANTAWCAISSGHQHTLALKTDGSLWGWGYSYFGQLGIGCAPGSFIFCSRSPRREITSSTTWCMVSGGYRHSLGIKTDGTLWGWGDRANGKLTGSGSGCDDSPVQECTNGTSWCFVASAPEGTNAIKTDGTLWGWGGDVNRTLAIATSVSNYSSPVQESLNATDWKFVACNHVGSSYNHGVTAIKRDGSLWSKSEYFGSNMSTMDLQQQDQLSTLVREYTCSNDWVKGMRGSSTGQFAGIKTSLPSTTLTKYGLYMCLLVNQRAMCFGWNGSSVIT